MTTEKFHYATASGAEITLPRMNQIKAGLIRRHRAKEPMDFIFSLLEELDDQENLAKIDDLSTDEFNDLVGKWQSEVTLGESSGSLS